MRKLNLIASLFAIFMLTGCTNINLAELNKVNPFQKVNQNIDSMNAQNFEAPVDVKYAASDSFVGYYKVMDTRRSYQKYHAYFTLYANNVLHSAEFFNSSSEIRRATKATWRYNTSNQNLFMNWTEGGEMSAFIKGDSNNFSGESIWFDKSKSTTIFSRISKEEVTCIENKGFYSNNKCLR